MHLTVNCGLLNNLSHGDPIWLIEGSPSIRASVFIVLKTPTFTRGKPQLTKSEVDFSQQLSLVRIRVERVIGIIHQKYTLLESTIPITFVMNDTTDCVSI